MLPTTPYDALDRLNAMRVSGEIDALSRRHGLDLLIVHGSVLEDQPLRASADLDIAFRYQADACPDVFNLVSALIEATGFEKVDPLDLRRADVVAKARALGPNSLLLYEATPGIFATAQLAAFKMEMETHHLRLLDLKLMAER